jgi:hypothetical protein
LSSNPLSKNVKTETYKTIILPHVLYGCDALPIILSEENTLRKFENRLMKNISGPKWDETTASSRKVHTEELCNF